MPESGTVDQVSVALGRLRVSAVLQSGASPSVQISIEENTLVSESGAGGAGFSSCSCSGVNEEGPLPGGTAASGDSEVGGKAEPPPAEPKATTESKDPSEVPASVLALVGSLRAADGLSGVERITRAYRAGVEARDLLSGARDRASRLVVRRIWFAVLAAKELEKPVVTNDRQHFEELVGKVASRFSGGVQLGTGSVAQAWPSRAEAVAYVRGAGVDYE